MDQRTLRRLEELTKQQQRIAQEISQLRSQRGVTIREIVAKMEKFDISLDDLREYVGNRKKYVNPTTGETWSGKGRKPFWMLEALQTVRSMDSFLSNN